MNTKHIIINILIGSIVLGMANAYLYTFRGLSFFATFAGYTMLTFVVLVFLVKFIPSSDKYHKPNAGGKKWKKQANRPNHSKTKPKKHPSPDADSARESSSDTTTIQGVVKWYDSGKGYGFLCYDDKEIFFHRQSIRSSKHHLRENDPVLFHIGESDKGPQATDVWLNK